MFIIIISSLISGIAGGMGIGGGTILIPALTIFAKMSQHTAQSTNLIFFIPTAITAIIIHIKNKNIDIKKALVLSLAGIPGAIIGSITANLTEGNVLRKMFGVFLVVFGLFEIFRKEGSKA